MSILSSYMQKEQAIQQLREELQKMESSEGLKAELAFKEALESLMAEYGKSSSEVIALLDPNYHSKPQTEETRKRKPRKLMRYTNPHTGEVVETRGGNQKTLKAWKEQYGSETVDAWADDAKGEQDATKTDQSSPEAGVDATKTDQKAPEANSAKSNAKQGKKRGDEDRNGGSVSKVEVKRKAV